MTHVNKGSNSKKSQIPGDLKDKSIDKLSQK